MPFAGFRRHRKKWLAAVTIFAMFGFILADTGTRLMQSGAPNPANTTVVNLYGKDIKRSELMRLAAQRSRANRFLYAIAPSNATQNAFGGLSDRELVDALILEREADELGMVATPQMAENWLVNTFKERIDGRMLDRIYHDQFRTEVSDEQLLLDLANQLRLMQVRNLGVTPVVSPYDVFQAYRDQAERVSLNAVAFPAEDFVAEVPEPSDSSLEAFYDKFKNVIANPETGTPGFQVPRRARAEYLTIDGKTLGVTATDEEVRRAYEKGKAEGRHKRTTPMPRLPADVFEADTSEAAVHTTQAEWDTPTDLEKFLPLEQERFNIEEELIREKIRKIVEDRFEKIRERMNAYSDDRAAAIEKANESAGRGKTAANPDLPPPPDLKALANKESLTYDSTPALTRDQADKFGAIGDSQLGFGGASRQVKFGEWLFEERSGLYEPVELSDMLDRYFLAWKTEEIAPEVPPLSKIRDEVVRAYKLEQALPLARKAAEALAEQARKAGGDLRQAAESRPVLVTVPTSKVQPTPPFYAQLGRYIPPRPNDLPPLVDVGDDIREAAFGLEPGGVAVAPNQSRSIFYVLAMANRTPASFEAFFSPYGERLLLSYEARKEAEERQFGEWLATLRRAAGLPDDWVPRDEEGRTRRPSRG
ncbi:MAG: hypothetical protein U0800_16380 [Isosphaeraceae bacterium]